MKTKEMKWNYIKCEREMIDFCLDKLKEYNTREYYEYGSYKPTNSDKLLDSSLKNMIDGRSALQYVYTKHIVEFLLKNGYKVKCKDFQQDNIILRMVGMVDSEDEFIEEYVKKVNCKVDVDEMERDIGDPFIFIPRSMYNKVREKIENVDDKFQIRTLNTSGEER